MLVGHSRSLENSQLVVRAQVHSRRIREQSQRWDGPANANGDLLRVAEHEFDVFLTVDQKLQEQQNLSAFNIAVIVLVAPANTLAELRPLMPKVLESLSTAKPGQALVIRLDT